MNRETEIYEIKKNIAEKIKDAYPQSLWNEYGHHLCIMVNEETGNAWIDEFTSESEYCVYSSDACVCFWTIYGKKSYEYTEDEYEEILDIDFDYKDFVDEDFDDEDMDYEDIKYEIREKVNETIRDALEINFEQSLGVPIEGSDEWDCVYRECYEDIYDLQQRINEEAEHVYDLMHLGDTVDGDLPKHNKYQVAIESEIYDMDDAEKLVFLENSSGASETLYRKKSGEYFLVQYNDEVTNVQGYIYANSDCKEPCFTKDKEYLFMPLPLWLAKLWVKQNFNCDTYIDIFGPVTE